MNSSNPCCIRLLGTPLVVAGGGQPITGRAVQRHRIALLALLTLGPGQGLSRERLLGHLWPESDPDRARHLLNQAIYQLRKALGEDAITSTGEELRLNEERVCADAVQFGRARALGDHATAVALYQGPFLDGFYLNEAVEFERWVERERSRLAGEFAKSLETLAEAAEADHDLRGAADWWRRRTDQDPFDSRVALRLMQALEADGNHAGALQHAMQHARLLREELEIAPAPEIAAFVDRLRTTATDSPSLTTRRRGVAAETQSHSRPWSAATVHPAPQTRSTETSPIDVLATPARAPTPSAGPKRHTLAITALTAAVAVLLMIWVASGTDDRWLHDEALPAIERYLDVADWESAYALAREAETRLPGNREVAELWPRIAWTVTIESEPEGATVLRQSYASGSTKWEVLGRTPLQGVRMPYGLSRIRLELDGYRPVLRALGGAHINWQELGPMDPDHVLVGPEMYRLDSAAVLPPDMVRVPGGVFLIGSDSVPVSDFLLGQYEVTNAEFKHFVDAGGYRRADLWDPIILRGETVPWPEAVAQFVDRTGRPGPSTWEAGYFPADEDDFPVSGVSWYEAAAFARFTGRELPTAHHWQHALANSMFPWLLPASNFASQRPRPVHQSTAMSHVGAFDLTGNVREWTATTIGSERVILGGSWTDPYYIAGTTDVSARPEDRSAGNGIRLAVTPDDPKIAAKLRAPIRKRATAAPVVTASPVTDDLYGAFSRIFDYDRSALDAVVESMDTTRLWIRERIALDAGYGAQRMPLHLYRPATGTPPYQTIVYWPGWDTFWLNDADVYFAKQVDFIVKSGRAVAFPIFRGTFERRVGDARRRPAFGTAEYRDNTVHTIKEMRRTVDYLETRSEIDGEAIAFFGYSWGGVNGPLAIAQEPRFRAAVIQIGLLPPMAATPEVDPINSLPRVRVPTLMFSGEFDPIVPRENRERYFALIGTPTAQKRHVIAIGGHFVPRELVIRETLDWLDRYLGRVER